jgi:multidrug resistance efflux pump
VKVVQRIPTRIKITGGTCDNAALSSGMSAYVSVDTGHRRWYRMLRGL